MHSCFLLLPAALLRTSPMAALMLPLKQWRQLPGRPMPTPSFRPCRKDTTRRHAPDSFSWLPSSPHYPMVFSCQGCSLHCNQLLLIKACASSMTVRHMAWSLNETIECADVECDCMWPCPTYVLLAPATPHPIGCQCAVGWQWWNSAVWGPEAACGHCSSHHQGPKGVFPPPAQS